MSGWLPKELLDQLKHAGYVAIPEDRVLDLHALHQVAVFELSMMQSQAGWMSHIRHAMAHDLGLEAMKAGYVALEAATFPEDDTVRMRATLTIIKPKVILNV